MPLTEIQKKNIKKALEGINVRIVGLIRYFKTEFGEDINKDKVIPKLTRCNKPDCIYCPHGPYWHRAIYNPKTNRWIFRYLGSELKKSMFRGKELEKFERYRYYDKELTVFRRERAETIKKIKRGL